MEKKEETENEDMIQKERRDGRKETNNKERMQGERGNDR